MTAQTASIPKPITSTRRALAALVLASSDPSDINQLYMLLDPNQAIAERLVAPVERRDARRRSVMVASWTCAHCSNDNRRRGSVARHELHVLGIKLQSRCV
jgi:hypothetical protein